MIGIKKFDEAREYWLDKLAELPDFSPLAPDFGVSGSTNIAETRFHLESTLASRLEQMGKGNHLSVYIILQTAFKILLSAFTDSDDLMVVSPVYDTNIQEYNRVVLLRDRLKGELTFRDFLLLVRSTVLEGYRYQYYPVEKLLDLLDVTKESPLFAFGFLHNAIHQRAFAQDYCLKNSAHIIVEYGVDETGCFLEILYDSKRFSSGTLQSFMDSFIYILRQAAADPAIGIQQIQFMDDGVKERVLREFNDNTSAFPHDRTLDRLFRDASERFRDRIALWGWSDALAGRECISYGELARQAGALTCRLSGQGADNPDVVGLLFEPSVEMIVAIFGVLGAGAAYLPLDPAFPQTRIEFMCRDSGVNVVVAQERFRRLVPRYCACLFVDGGSGDEENAPDAKYVGSPTDLAYTIYTSGTTGDPKGVQVEHRGVVNYIHWRITTYGVTAEDVSLQPLSYCFDGFVSNMYTPLLSGGLLVMVPEEDRLDFAAMAGLVERHRVTNVSLVPGLFSALLDSGTAGCLQSLRFVVLAGEATQSRLLGRIKKELPGLLLVNEYGPTEATVTSAAQVGMDGEAGIIGRPIANTCIYILDRQFKPVPPGATGQLFISGPGLARAYVDSPALTAQKFVPVPRDIFDSTNGERMYASGDLARFREDGRIQLLGRTDLQVKIRGHRIELEEIENRLAMMEPVREAVAVARVDGNGDQYICAYVVGRDGKHVDIDAIRRELEDHVPGYMIPRFVMAVEKIERTAAGKLNRHALPEPQLFSGQSMAFPSDHTENVLADIWAQILSISRDLLGIDADFFTIGGHSLNATRMVSLIHKELGAAMTLAEIFEARTIRRLAELIRPRVESRAFQTIQPAEEREYYLLSPAQKRLFVLQQLELHSIAYNMPEVIELQEEPDLRRLEDAFLQLIHRHESLRTGFEMKDGYPAQQIRRHVEFAIERFQLQSSSKSDSNMVNSWIKDTVKRFVRPFDLAHPPLLRVGVVTAIGKRPVLLVDMHHIIGDGVSMGILTDEFMQLLAGEALPPVRLQYKDYSQWLAGPVQEESALRQKEFWLRQFSGEVPELHLPLDFSRPQVQDFSGDALPFVLDEAIAAQLNELARRHDATLYMALLALFNILLFKLSLQEDIVVGTPLAGRRHADLERMIGMFVNTLALRNFPRGESSFVDFLADVRTRTLEAFENQEYQFEELVEQLSLRRDISRNPLFDVMFSMQHLEQAGGDRKGPQPESDRPGDVTFHSSKFDLTFSAVERDEKIFCRMTYALRLFKRGTIETWIRYFINVVRQVCAAPDQPFMAIDLLDEADRKRWLQILSTAETPHQDKKPVYRLLEDHIQQSPHRVAVCEPSARLHITFCQMEHICRAGAATLRTKGIRRGDIVAFLCRPGVEIPAGIFSILAAGACFLPIDPALPADRVRYILNDSRASLLLALRGTGMEFEDDIRISYVDEFNFHTDISAVESGDPQYHDPAYVIYTSGTTGRPKGVQLLQRNLVNYIFWFSKILGLGRDDRSLPVSSFAYDLGYSALFPAICSGGRLTLVSKEEYMEPGVLLDIIAKERISYLKLTPSFFAAIVQHPGFVIQNTRHLRWIVLGGEAIISSDVERAWQRCPHLRFMNHYGPTEATIGAVARVLDRAEIGDYSRQPAIGRPVANTFACVVDAYGQVLPPGIPGELCIAGAGLAAGYLNRPELTARSFTPLPAAGKERAYHTGDLAVMEENGEIRFLGRKDHQVKIRGFRVEPAEVEQTLIRHPQVNEAALLALDHQTETYLAAYVVPADGESPVTEAELHLYLAERLPDYMIPSVFAFLRQLPLTANGKLDRGALPLPDFSGENPSTLPETETQQHLIAIWSEILGLEAGAIGIDDDFFRIGGHSLRATIMISKIQAELGVRVPLAEVFKTPTVKGLALFVSSSDKEFYDSIRPAETKPYYPQSSAQKRMFFLDQFEEIGVSYNMPFVLEVPGQLDIQSFQHTLDALIARHETLRTSFGLVEGDPVQFIHRTEDIQFKIQEITTNEPVSSPEKIRELLDSFVRPFNLSRPPLLRVAALRLPEERNLLFFDIHHIVFDGSSRAALTEEFIRIYSGEELPPLRLHYKDFSVWQNRMIACGRIREQERYWMDVFSGEVPVLDLPTDFSRPPVFLFEGANHDFQLDAAHSERFINLCRERGATVFMGLMAIFNVLLYKYAGQDDIVVGTGIAGRHHADLQHIVGMFVNSLALRNRPGPEQTFAGLLGEVRDHALHAFENQDVQFEDLVDKLNLPRDPSRNPLFSTTLVLQNFERSERKLEGAEVSRVAYENRASKVDLALFAQEGNGQLYFSFEYCTRLFKASTIRRMAGALENVILQALERPDDLIGSFHCVSREEKEQLLREINGETGCAELETTLHRLWRDRVEESPHRMAFSDDDRQFTYTEVESRAFRLACYLRRNGVSDGMPVGILMDNSAELAMVMIAVIESGGAYVPMDPATPEERLRVMIDDAAIGIILSQKRSIRTLNRLQWDCPGFHTFLCLDSRDIWAEREVEESGMMDKTLWQYIGRQAEDDIAAGGWVSSYTGKPISPLEMEEFGDNALKKLTPLLNPRARVLEIGCASGYTMYRVAPLVKCYVGTDLSSVIIDRNRRRVELEHIENIELHCLAAHEIGALKNQTFDVIIVNSVIQSFHGLNYLRQVLEQAVGLLDRKGALFIGDVMDQDLKKELKNDLLEYRRLHRGEPKITTKTDFSDELFVSRDFFNDWRVGESAIVSINFSSKIHTIENELTRFRYDVLVTVDKDNKREAVNLPLRKRQHDIGVLEEDALDDVVLPEVSPSQAAYMIFTSGTTGVPKGIVIRHRNIVNYCLWRRDFYGLTANDCALQLISPAFDGFASNLYPSLLAGGKVAMIHRDFRLDYEYIANVIQRERVTHFSVVPAMYREILECAAPGELDSVRLAVLAAEGAGEALIEMHEANAPHITLANEYGPTENAVATAAYIGTGRQSLGIVGRPVARNLCLVLANDLSLLPVGVPGQLAVSGDSLGCGYLNRPELTADCFIGSPFFPGQVMYRTGDRVRRLEDGNLEFLGRVDSQIKIRGFRVEIAEIRKRLLADGDVRDAVVTTIGNGDSLSLAAYVEPVSRESGKDDPAMIASLKEHLSRFLPDYMIPSFYSIMDVLPRNASGKIDRKALPQPGTALGTNDDILPGSMEERMRSVWAGVLGIDANAISIKTSFFDLGGNSLKATALQRKIQAELEVKIPLADIFKTPTIEDLIGFLDAGDPGILVGEDTQLECLKRQAQSDGNLFLVHAGSGEVDGYAEFCSHLAPAFTCWGIKSEKPAAYAPFNITIEALAKAYADKILAMQHRGPYYIFGWCIGGTIAFEIARQLEQMGRTVAMVAMVNSSPPDDEAVSSAIPFTLAEELDWLAQAVPHLAEEKKLEEAVDLEELWTFFAQALERQPDGATYLKRRIPPQLARAIPNFETLECGPVLTYFNRGRSLSRARLLYVPPQKLAAPVSFFQVQEGGNVSWESWQKYCSKPMRVFELRGDHFSVFKKPFAEEFSRLFGKLIRTA